MSFTLIAAPLLLGMMATASPHTPEPDATVERSLISPGDPAVLYRVFAKGRAGQPIVLGSIGGSITEGASASTPGHRYPNLVKRAPPADVPQVQGFACQRRRRALPAPRSPACAWAATCSPTIPIW